MRDPEVRYCKCGCGTVVEHDWVKGHHMRGLAHAETDDERELLERIKGPFAEETESDVEEEEDLQILPDASEEDDSPILIMDDQEDENLDIIGEVSEEEPTETEPTEIDPRIKLVKAWLKKDDDVVSLIDDDRTSPTECIICHESSQTYICKKCVVIRDALEREEAKSEKIVEETLIEEEIEKKEEKGCFLCEEEKTKTRVLEICQECNEGIEGIKKILKKSKEKEV